MVERSIALHQHTPALQLVDPRGLPVGSIALCRTSSDIEPQIRTSHASFDMAGRPVSCWDPRLWTDRAPANLSVIHSLSGQVLASDSVDAGWRVLLAGEAGQVLEAWDARGVVRRTGYDALLRPIEVFEDEHCVERLLYGGPDSTAHNQCGQLIRHDDPAGTRLDDAYGLSGNVIRQTRRFLHSANEPDWPESLTGRDALLEPGDGATTRWQYNPLNESTQQTDAQGNVQCLGYTVAGQLKDSRLQLNGQAEQVLVSAIQYDAQQRVVSETAGNGVISTARYDTEDGRLLALNATRSNGQLLQDLRYDYDPVGNVIRVDDRALPAISKGQRIDSVSTYRYDTLYQLIEASGREWAVVNHGPVLPGFQSPADPSTLADYTQTYRYDAGGNLQQLTHTGTQSHSRTLVTAHYSNRSLPVINGHIPDEAEIAAAFDANGNLLALQAGQDLSWDRRNQLQQVRPVVRDDAADDSERYIYDASGQRLRKVRTTQAKAVTHIADVRYLPGLEVRTDSATGETLHVVVAQAGRNNVRVLHWASGKPDALENDQTRYTLNDHLGSGTLELDGQAQRVSQESYYPFGGTSWWAGRNAIEASYKTVRYSGKERDATGLYYYGLRYYAPWLQRWINPDPEGVESGLNFFNFSANSPIVFVDIGGLTPFPFEKINNPKVLAAIRSGSYLEAQTLARETRAFNDVASINEWLVSLMRVTKISDAKRFDNRLNNTLLTMDVPDSSIKLIIKKVNFSTGAQREELAFIVSHKLKLNLVPPTIAKAKIAVQQMIVGGKKNTTSGVKFPEDAKFFYHLVNQIDDNSGNQLWRQDGSVYLIDHESTFSTINNQAYTLENIDLLSVFDVDRWAAFNSIGGGEWRKIIAQSGSTLKDAEIDAFLHRVAQTKISVQKHIDQGTASFGKKRSLMQRVLNKKTA
ncbi:RHS repeat domain-containing protein [Pseudomonas sp. SZ57]|uniref:RHS repeat domain-containing protein n=1 Tax=Pseudomonas sp. SZ57 TaxID=2662259 RepID=UPI002113BDF3|nr:RHS repeat-associated core domain-containing protein [Pseudomonas sp. SZ57]